MQRIKLTLAYDGTKFAGWQLQPGLRTVQGVLEAAVTHMIGHVPGAPLTPDGFIRLHASGRTDSGVHASGQVAHFDAPDARRGFPWQKALNGNLPPDVSVVDVEQVPRAFHARFSVRAKTYAYTLWHEPGYVLPQRRPFVWKCGPVDFAAMEEAARIFLGEHDFAAFRNTGSEVESTVRTLLELRCSPGLLPQESIWHFRATGFLKQMVRNLMGCLVAVGQGKVNPGKVRSYLQEGDRTAAPATAPAQGLCLERVEYPVFPSKGAARDEHQMDSGNTERT
ncbi:MAG: tRNA pseudouridine(38-40) synthase TruA [Desulfovibrio sp.]